MKNSQKQKLVLNNAYRQISFIDQNAKRVLHQYDGPKQFQGMFVSMKENQQSLQIQKQPLYFDQVDHNIQEVGIMAVKEVRYLTDQQWQQWMKGRENINQLFEEPKSYKYQSRHQLATNRSRNQKGQFLSKPKQQIKKQKILKSRKIKKKRGRKPKNHLVSESNDE